MADKEKEYLREGLRFFIIETLGALNQELEYIQKYFKRTGEGKSMYRNMRTKSGGKPSLWYRFRQSLFVRILLAIWYAIPWIIFANGVSDNDPTSLVDVDGCIDKAKAKQGGGTTGHQRGIYYGYLQEAITDLIKAYETLKEKNHDENERPRLVDTLYKTWEKYSGKKDTDYAFVVLFARNCGLTDDIGAERMLFAEEQEFINRCRAATYKLSFPAKQYTKKMFAEYEMKFKKKYEPAGESAVGEKSV